MTEVGGLQPNSVKVKSFVLSCSNSIKALSFILNFEPFFGENQVLIFDLFSFTCLSKQGNLQCRYIEISLDFMRGGWFIEGTRYGFDFILSLKIFIPPPQFYFQFFFVIIGCISGGKGMCLSFWSCPRITTFVNEVSLSASLAFVTRFGVQEGRKEKTR